MDHGHPLDRALADWLPKVDFAVLSHGFAPHGRDYVLIVQAGATFELTLTHVVELQYETRVADEVWPASWSDSFIDYEAWQSAGEPGGYVWGTNWSLAYPGLSLLTDDRGASSWSNRLGKMFHAITLETDRFKMRIVFHDTRAQKISDERSPLSQVIVPLPQP